jgi:uncharacterized alpha-E superfamily protein
MSALSVVGADGGWDRASSACPPFNARRHLTLSPDNPNSIRRCVEIARDNARAVRNSVTLEVWEAINRAWYNLQNRTSPAARRPR